MGTEERWRERGKTLADSGAVRDRDKAGRRAGWGSAFAGLGRLLALVLSTAETMLFRGFGTVSPNVDGRIHEERTHMAN